MTSLVIVHLAEGTAILRRNRRSRWHRLQIWCRWEDRYSPENWASGNPALAVVRGSCSTLAYISSTHRCVPQHAIVPFAFPLQVGWVIQAPPSECFLAEPGIQVRRDTAHT